MTQLKQNNIVKEQLRKQAEIKKAQELDPTLLMAAKINVLLYNKERSSKNDQQRYDSAIQEELYKINSFIQINSYGQGLTYINWIRE